MRRAFGTNLQGIYDFEFSCDIQCCTRTETVRDGSDFTAMTQLLKKGWTFPSTRKNSLMLHLCPDHSEKHCDPKVCESGTQLEEICAVCQKKKSCPEPITCHRVNVFEMEKKSLAKDVEELKSLILLGKRMSKRQCELCGGKCEIDDYPNTKRIYLSCLIAEFLIKVKNMEKRLNSSQNRDENEDFSEREKSPKNWQAVQEKSDELKNDLSQSDLKGSENDQN